MASSDSSKQHCIPEFNRTQLHILQILWDADQALKPSQIAERFDWDIDNATLRSVLRVLLDRGELDRDRQGKAYYYKPAKRKQKALSQVVSGLAQIFADGSKVGLIAQLLQDSTLTESDRKALQRIAEGEDFEV